MSLASKVIQEVEDTVAQLVVAHDRAVSEIEEQTTLAIERLQRDSQEKLGVFQEQREKEVSAALAVKEAELVEHTKEALLQLTTAVTKKESDLIASILKEVSRRYGGL